MSVRPKHSLEEGQCRFFDYQGRRASERTGRNPRDPRRPGYQDPTQQLRMGTEETRRNTGLEPFFDDESDTDRSVTSAFIPDDYEAPLVEEPEDEQDGASTPPAEGLGEVEMPTVKLEAKHEGEEETDEGHIEERMPRPRPRRIRERRRLRRRRTDRCATEIETKTTS